MFKHYKRLMHPVRIEKPNAAYAGLLQEQLGGTNGELKAAMQYMAQSFYVEDQAMKDMLMEVAAEEFNHMEMVAKTIALLNGDKPQQNIQQSFGFVNATGYPFSADYIAVTGDFVTDLLSNISSEQRSKAVYESLYTQIEDKRVKNTIEYLLHREKMHKLTFLAALKELAPEEEGLEFGSTNDQKLFFKFKSLPKGQSKKENEVAPPGFYHPDEK